MSYSPNIKKGKGRSRTRRGGGRPCRAPEACSILLEKDPLNLVSTPRGATSFTGRLTAERSSKSRIRERSAGSPGFLRRPPGAGRWAGGESHWGGTKQLASRPPPEAGVRALRRKGLEDRWFKTKAVLKSGTRSLVQVPALPHAHCAHSLHAT